MTDNNKNPRFNQRKFSRDSVVWGYPYEAEYVDTVHDVLVTTTQRKKCDEFIQDLNQDN